jgi:hypothetical protein
MNGVGYGITPFMGASGILARSSGGGGGGFVNEYSMTFDGASDFVTLGNPTSLRLTADISVSCWMKFTDSGATRYALSMGDQYGLYTSGGTIRGFARIGGSFTALSSVGTFNDGNWHHVMYVKNATNMLLYIDGSLNASNTSGGINTSSTLDQRIGSRYTNANYYDGNIDSVAIWNSDQSSNINSIYSASGVVDISSLNPLGWWRMGDGDSFSNPGGVGDWTLFDNGSGGNDGTSSTLPEGARVSDVP